MTLKRPKINFLEEIEEPDYTIDPEQIAADDHKQWEAYERQTRRNQMIRLKKDLFAQYQAGVIDQDGNRLLKQRKI